MRQKLRATNPLTIIDAAAATATATATVVAACAGTLLLPAVAVASTLGLATPWKLLEVVQAEWLPEER